MPLPERPISAAVEAELQKLKTASTKSRYVTVGASQKGAEVGLAWKPWVSWTVTGYAMKTWQGSGFDVGARVTIQW